MDKRFRRWTCAFLAAILLLLTASAAVVWVIDPALYYRMPTDWPPVFFNERYQSAGLAKNVEADTVLVGTSMAANYRASRVGEAFGGTGLRITIPDGYFSEFDRVMDTLFRHQSPERVVFVLDLNVLIRGGEDTGAMPAYLYNANLLDDAKYLLNKDNLYYSFFVLMSKKWGAKATLDESFVWDKGIWWNHATAIAGYPRPDVVTEQEGTERFLSAAAENLAIMDGWIAGHPETQFEIFFSPYSMLFWDKTIRLGQTDGMFAALELACETLTAYDNVALYGYLMDTEFVEDLDNYCDHLHHSTEMGDRVLAKLAAGEGRITKENAAVLIADWREFVVHYDYEKFWDKSFWEAWNAAKAAA